VYFWASVSGSGQLLAIVIAWDANMEQAAKRLYDRLRANTDATTLSFTLPNFQGRF
jgi:hypothetical protein